MPATSLGTGCTAVHRSEHPFPGFLVTVRALWPRKTAAHLAAAAGVTERAAKFWLAGDREPSPEAFKAIVDRVYARRR
jgi:hypothetical protein